MSNISVSKTPNGIFDVISAIDRGEALLNVEQACMEVVDAVRTLGKSGKVTIELGFVYDSQADAMRVTSTVKKKMPEAQARASLFFMTPEGHLTKMDNRQRDMFITNQN